MDTDTPSRSIEDLAEKVNESPIKGLVVSAEEVWFPYSVEAVKLLREGLILAVRNTASVHLTKLADEGTAEDQHFSLLRIESVDTRHFIIDKIRQDRSDTPVSVEGLLEKHQREWRRTTSDPEENNLRIVATVSETGQELHLPMAAAVARGFGSRITASNGRTMLGEVAFLMVQEVVEQIVNRGMPRPDPLNDSIVAGSHTLYRNPPLEVLLDTSSLFRRHFGIFGFTGAGKSNLLSSLVSRSLGPVGSDAAGAGSNVVIFDVNNEFFGLLADALVDHDSHVVFLDEDIGDAMGAFLDGDYSMLDRAAVEFLRTTTLSAAVEAACSAGVGRDRMLSIIRLLLAAGRFKRFQQASEPLALALVLAQIVQHGETLTSRLRGSGQTKKREAWRLVLGEIGSVSSDTSRSVTGSDFRKVQAVLDAASRYCGADAEEGENPFTEIFRETIPRGVKDPLHRDLVRPLAELALFVVELEKSFSSPIRPLGHSIDQSGMWSALHDDRRTVILLLGEENSLRSFSSALGGMVYGYRRRHGVTSPTTVFIFDEADVFIPGQSASAPDDDKESIRLSKHIATQISRRGRKYGLGLGISTQRIAYLDTSILAQLGTYFVGRLPRLSDRQKITEGFGIERESVQSGISGPGDWVLLSHTAVGDRGAPLPVHFDDANRRVIEFIADFDPSRYVSLEALRAKFDYLVDLVDHSSEIVSPVTDLSFLP